MAITSTFTALSTSAGHAYSIHNNVYGLTEHANIGRQPPPAAKAPSTRARGTRSRSMCTRRQRLPRNTTYASHVNTVIDAALQPTVAQNTAFVSPAPQESSVTVSTHGGQVIKLLDRTREDLEA